MDCSDYFTGTDIKIINLNVPLGGSINEETSKMKDILSISELGKMKDEITNDTIVEACFHKAKAY